MTVYDILLFYEQFTTIGLAENMVYDIIPIIPAAVGNTTVNASVFDVECAALPHATQWEDSGVDPYDPLPTWVSLFSLDEQGLEVVFLPVACASKRCSPVVIQKN